MPAEALEQQALGEKQDLTSFPSITSFGLFSGLSGIGLALLAGIGDDPVISSLLTAVLSAGLYAAPAQGTGSPIGAEPSAQAVDKRDAFLLS